MDKTDWHGLQATMAACVDRAKVSPHRDEDGFQAVVCIAEIASGAADLAYHLLEVPAAKRVLLLDDWVLAKICLLRRVVEQYPSRSHVATLVPPWLRDVLANGAFATFAERVATIAVRMDAPLPTPLECTLLLERQVAVTALEVVQAVIARDVPQMLRCIHVLEADIIAAVEYV